MKRALLLLALAATLALPFALRPRTGPDAAADDTLVIISPHNEAVRTEFGHAFQRWYRARTGRTVAVDWRVIGGTSEIARFLDGGYTAAFEAYWTGLLHRPWSNAVQAGFATDRPAPGAPPAAAEARAAFLASDVGCGIDLFFGGGSFDFARQAQAGRLMPSGVLEQHPDWFGEAAIPAAYAGAEYRDPVGRWIGCVLSNFGIISNGAALQRLGLDRPPAQWADLADPRYLGRIALADPTKSGSIAAAFENVIQQQMQQRLLALAAAAPGGDPAAREAQAVREGWTAGLRLLQLIAANGRYFTDSAQKVPIDVAAGDCAAGLCIDFFARQQEESLHRRGVDGRIGYVAPAGGTVASVDPVALLRGAPHRAVAAAFIEFVLSPEGQKIWGLKAGAPGGPEHYALRRLPVRRDFYAQADLIPWRSDPGDAPFADRSPLVYRPAWTGGLFREMSFVIRVMCIDAHPELVRAWREINAAGQPAEAMAALQDVGAVNYAAVQGRIHAALAAPDRLLELRLADELGASFRRQYDRAAELARAKR